jgi:hypothetical protein
LKGNSPPALVVRFPAVLTMRGQAQLIVNQVWRSRGVSALVETQKTVRQVLGWLGFDKLLPIFFVGGHLQKNTVNQNTIGLEAIQDVFGTLVSRDVEAFAICSHTTEPPDGFMRMLRVRSIPGDAGDLTAHLNAPNSKRALEALSSIFSVRKKVSGIKVSFESVQRNYVGAEAGELMPST